MSKEKGRRDFRAAERIDVSDRHQVEFWMKRWGVTKEQITAAVRAAGQLTKDVAVHLGKKR